MSLFVGDILKSATIVPANCELQEAVRLMISENRDRVYVTNENGHVSGVACDFILLKALIRGESSDVAVGQLSAVLQEHLTPTQPLEEAAVSFRIGYRTQLPVFENGQFLGIVERTSLLAALLQEGVTPCLHANHDANRENCMPVVSALNGLLNHLSMKTG